MSVTDRMKKMKVAANKPPVWEGPCGKGPQGGITFSLLCRYLVCKDRFKALVVEGLKSRDVFNHRIEVGNMWHLCEEAMAAGRGWEDVLRGAATGLCVKYRLNQEEIIKWAGIVHVMFPLYREHWLKHPDMVSRTPLFQEKIFDVPYTLPDGRVVRLRSKIDSGDRVKSGDQKGDWIHENKTKSEIDEEGLGRQLGFDLQSNLYKVIWDVAADIGYKGVDLNPARGVRYNVVKRPRQYQGKKETVDEFHVRLEKIIREKPEEFFSRWNTEISDRDIAVFKKKCLDPVLMQLCLWYDVVVLGEKVQRFVTPDLLHFTFPYGVYNVLTEGGIGDLDNYIFRGDRIGLREVKSVFTELET